MHSGTIIFLIGPRASGKTTAGLLLSATIGLDFVDTDIHMLDHDGLTVAEVVAREGWDGFRRREAAALRRVAQPGRVVATGGGIVLARDNRDFMRGSGTVLYLAAPAAVLVERLAACPDPDQRPSLTGKSVLDEMKEILAQREELYRMAAHHQLDASADTPTVVAEAMRRLGIAPSS